MRGLVAGVVGLGAFFGLAPPTLAACAAPPPPRERLTHAQAAFIGVVESATPASPNPVGITETTYTFHVERAFKAQLGDRIELRAGSTGEDLRLRVGERVGLFLGRNLTGEWYASVCSRIDPDELARAALPLPRPAQGGPVRLLLAGPFGDVAAVALDGRGRVRGYVRPPAGAPYRPRSIIAPCPGGRFAVTARGRSPVMLTVRSFPDLRWVGRIRSPGGGDLTRLECADESGRAALVLTNPGVSQPARLLVARAGQDPRLLLAGAIQDATLAGRTAYATVADRGLVAVAIGTATERTIAPVQLRDLAVAPGGDRIAGTGPNYGVVVVNGVRSGPIGVQVGPTAGSPAWADERTLVVQDSVGGLLVLDGKLRTIRSIAPGTGFDAFTAAHGRVFLARSGRLLKARARGGPVGTLARLPVDGPTALLPVGSSPP